MDTRWAWFIAGAASAAILLSVAWYAFGPDHAFERGKANDDFYNAFAIHGPLDTDWSHVYRIGELDLWSDEANTSLAITQDGRAVQLLTSDTACCTFEIFERGEYKATVKYGNYDQRLISRGADQNGEVWTYVDMGINGTIDFRFKDGIANSTEQVVVMQFASDENAGNQYSRQAANSGW